MNLEGLKEKIAYRLLKSVIDNKKQNWKPGNFIKYSGPYFDSNEYLAAIKSVMKGWFILGEKGREFEKTFAPKLGKEDGIITNSGSSANLLMVSVLKSDRWDKKLKTGDKFITPVVCFPTTINPLIQNGFEPIFVDVELPNLNLNLDQVEDILKQDVNHEIKGIIFAHVLGNPPDMDRLMRIVKQYKLIYLEDSCDALGGKWDGKHLGSFGDISTCSFFPAHHMTMGEGGFVATNSKRVRMALASFRDWGRACYCNTSKAGDVTEGTACGCRLNTWFKDHKDIVYDHRYVFEEIGYNLKPTEMQAAMGLEQIKKLDIMHAKRKHNFSRLLSMFESYDHYFHLPYKLDKADPSWFGFLITLKDGSPFTKEELVNYFEENKIQTRSYFSGNCLMHPAYKEQAKKYVDPAKEFPIATYSTKNTFFLGVAPQITDDQMDYIEEVLDKFMDKY